MRQRVWEAAHVKLTSVTFDTDTTVHTVYGKQMGARKSYNPKNKGKKSFQPILTFCAETKEFVGGELRNGDRPTGKQIAKHLESVMTTVPKGVKVIYGRADCGFYCWQAVQAYEQYHCQFIVVAQKTPRLLEELKAAHWKRSPHTDADEECEFRYRPQGWGRTYRFIALRYEKKSEPKKKEEPEQYQLFATAEYTYRVFVTNMDDPLDVLVWFYRQRATAENLIKEANNDAGLAAHPSNRWAMNCVHFQLAMLAYNLNCWLVLFNREKTADPAEMKHTQLSTTRLRFLFLAAKIWSHGGRVGVSYSDHYEEKGIFQRLMDRLRSITDGATLPANEAALTTYTIGRTQTETIKGKLKKDRGSQAHCTATRPIFVHYLGYRFQGRIDTASPPGISAASKTVFNAFSTVAAWTRLSLVGAACTTADRNPQGARITRPAYPPHASAAFSFLRHSSAVVPSRSKGTLLFGLENDPANF